MKTMLTMLMMMSVEDQHCPQNTALDDLPKGRWWHEAL